MKNLININVEIELGNAQLNKRGKIIGYDEIEVCRNCGNPLEDNHKYCCECGTMVREEIKNEPTIKILEVTDEEFERDMNSFEMIEIEDIRYATDEVECQFETAKDVIESLKEVFGTLRVIPEVKEFMNKYGEEYEEKYGEDYYIRLLREIKMSDVIISKPLTITEHIVEDCCGTDWGFQDLSYVYGYDLVY